MITGARFVLFDFDGPICRLFAGRSAEGVAKDLVSWLERQGLKELLTQREREHPDPHRRPARGQQAPPTQRSWSTNWRSCSPQHELKAVDSAYLPPRTRTPLIRTWNAVGIHLAIATNNSPRTVTEYLHGRGPSGVLQSAHLRPHQRPRPPQAEPPLPEPHAPCARWAPTPPTP
ncbi:hypothetical protein ACRAWF_45310 [Streptomyces sp. L7]